MKHFILLFTFFMLSGFSFSQMITRDMLGPGQETALKALYRSLNVEHAGNCSFHWDTIQGTYYNYSPTANNKIHLDENGMITALNFEQCWLNGYIPDEIGLLTELKVLYLFLNCIYSISEEICQTQLEWFTLASDNNNYCYQSNKLPACFKDLSFNYLLVFKENITEIPEFSLGNDVSRYLITYTKITSLPETFSGLPQPLSEYAFMNNELEEIPVFPSDIKVSLRENRLQFDDLEKNMSVFPSSIYYAPQKPVRVASPQYCCAGNEMRLLVEVGGSANRYRWLKDGVEVQPFSDEPAYVKPGATPADAGTYTVEITNELVPGLTLQSEPIEVIIGNPPPPLIRHNE